MTVNEFAWAMGWYEEAKEINAEVLTELDKAVVKHGIFQTPMCPAMDQRDRFVILSEEVGEVARAMTYDEGDKNKLIEELIQVAAMATAAVVGLRNE